MQTVLTFYVNGKKIVEEKPDPEWTLGHYLRNKLLLKGTKISCGEGQCGLCTVMLSKYDLHTKTIKHSCINACLISVASLHGCAITTVEGIGSVQRGLHPVQERLAKRHGAQCGFCTPGFVMSMYTLLRKNPKPSKQDVEAAIEGNLCRCTGYRPILEAFYSFTDPKCPCGFQGECCKSEKKSDSVITKESPIAAWEHLRPYDATQDPIFPPELTSFAQEPLCFTGSRVKWLSPTTLTELSELMLKNPGAKVIGAGALTGLQERTSNEPHKVLITISGINEIHHVKPVENHVSIGGALTIHEFFDGLKHLAHQPNSIKLLLQALPTLGYEPLRNSASWVGNVASGWYISDISLCLLVTNSELRVRSADGKERNVKVDNNFFVGHWKTSLELNEVVIAALVPTQEDPGILHEFYHAKQGIRHGHDAAIVNSAAGFTIDKKTMILKEASFSFGGFANRPYLITLKPECELKNANAMLWQKMLLSVESELEKVIDKQFGRNEYRITLALSLVYKFTLALQQKLAGKETIMDEPKYQEVQGTQIVPEVLSGQPAHDAVGRPLGHNSIEKHVTGQSVYCDDMPPQIDECHMALVLSERAHAKILLVDPSAALSIPGVIGWVGCAEIPEKGTNCPGAPLFQRTIFARDKVESFGETIGGILAEDPQLARRAAKLVKVVYEDLHSIITIDDAIEANAFYEPTTKETKGNPEKGFSESECVLSGEARLNYQEHFYLETQSCLVVPRDGNEYEIYCATQSPSWLQMQAAAAIGISANKIIVKMKRIGGAFGGKTDQASACAWPAIVAAHKFQRPVRHVFTRPEDMIATGKRPYFLAEYKVGFQRDGTISAVEIHLFVNAGRCLDFVSFVTQHCAENIDNGYHFPNMYVEAKSLRTNLPINTFMRGAGQPEGQFLLERMIERVAQFLNINADVIRRKHLYKNGDLTLHHLTVKDCTMERCWEECLQLSQYNLRKVEVENFNKQNKYKKRGITMMTCKTAVGLVDTPFEQGGVLVHIYLDGSVQISHGGAEMGQGLNTKLLQIASRALKVPYENITIIETATDKVPNGLPTGGSIGTDVYGPAVKEACEILLQRLEPFMFQNPKGRFDEWVQVAHMSRVSLSATGYSRPKSDSGNPDGKDTGKPRYYVWGAGCTEVEIDCLTGDHFTLQSDLVMDFGQTINPALDIGQIEGAYTQGFGLTTIEEILHDSNGRLITNSAANYKVPTINTVPKKFRCVILKNDVYRGNIYSSKGVGEPPLTLGFGAYFAIINAIKAARAEAGITESFGIDSPATAEKIRLALPKKIAFVEDSPNINL